MTAWTDNDLRHITSLGMDPSVVSAQLEIFRNPPSPIRLERPATVGDGIRVLTPGEIEKAVEKYDRARGEGRFQKFVPASGAATRMFQALNRCLLQPPVLRGDLRRKADGGDVESRQTLELMESIHRAAFAGDLRSALEARGITLEELLLKGDFTPILEALLTTAGLDYSRKPKGLIPFHRGPEGGRSPLREQIEEAVLTIADSRGRVRIHFTVPPEYQKEFERQALEARALFQEKGFNLKITFSIQKAATDTLAVDLSNEPFRDGGGKLVLRPGGHGALIENLNDLQGDLVYVKNIDNVVQRSFLAPTVLWKKILGGVLVELEEELRAGNGWKTPLRVCGVVRNTGEPGGGPFWVAEKEGGVSLQIVESSQVDGTAPGQQEIFESSSYFNPVDLVCSLRDPNGKPFDLRKFVDREAVFFSKKSHGGRDLKALELPGLWNGAMGGWKTIFVEVPLETFNPVKTVFDLLKPVHSNG